MLDQLSNTTMKAFAEKEHRKTMPSYPAFQSAYRDMLAHGDHSPCARNDDNGYLATCRKTWDRVVEESQAVA